MKIGFFKYLQWGFGKIFRIHVHFSETLSGPELPDTGKILVHQAVFLSK